MTEIILPSTSVLDGGRVNVSILPLEQSCNPGSKELVFVARFIPEQNNASNLRSLVLFLLSNIEATTDKFLCPERTKNLERSIPSGDLLPDRCLHVEFYSVSIPEP